MGRDLVELVFAQQLRAKEFSTLAVAVAAVMVQLTPALLRLHQAQQILAAAEEVLLLHHRWLVATVALAL
jgi:hypothetical protein